MRTLAVVATAAVAIASFAGAADANARPRHHRHHAKKHHAHPPKPRPASFDGSCDFSGAVTFTPPMTSTPQPIAQHAVAPGTCTGTFVDHAGATHKLAGASVTYRAESAGDSVSCALGMASGNGTLEFEAGSLAFTMHEYRVAATPLIELTGTAGGDAWLAATPAPGSNPADSVAACNGAGLQEFDLQGHLQTNGPMSG